MSIYKINNTYYKKIIAQNCIVKINDNYYEEHFMRDINSKYGIILSYTDSLYYLTYNEIKELLSSVIRRNDGDLYWKSLKTLIKDKIWNKLISKDIIKQKNKNIRKYKIDHTGDDEYVSQRRNNAIIVNNTLYEIVPEEFCQLLLSFKKGNSSRPLINRFAGLEYKVSSMWEKIPKTAY